MSSTSFGELKRKAWSLPDPALAALIVLPILAILLIAEIAGGGKPLALLGAGILVYAFVCIVHLETAFLIILAITPFSAEMVFRGTGGALQIPTEPMLFLALLAWGFRFLGRGSTRFEQPVLTVVLLLALGTCLVSIVDTAYPLRALKATANAVWYALFGIFIYNNFRSGRRLRSLIPAWLVPGAIICVYSFVNVLLGNYEPLAGYWSAGPFFPEHGTFAAYLSFVCMLSLALVLETGGVRRLLFAFVALLSGAQIVLSLTRGAWMGMAAGIVFLLFVSGRRLFRPGSVLLASMGVAVLLAAVISSGAGKAVEKQTGRITDASYVSNLERLNRWYAGWSMFREDPLNGVGYGTYSDNSAAFRRVPLGTEQSAQFMGVHSEYLRVLSETGLLGAAAALLALLTVGGLAVRAIRGSEDPVLRGLAVGMAGGLVTYLVHAFVNDYLGYDKAAIPVWTAVGVLAALGGRDRSR
jgi:putative inorganic carbon (hco3(-)) transporter